MAAKELLAVPEAADYLNVTTHWIRRRIHERRLPYVKLDGLVRLRRCDLDAYVERCVVEAR